MAKFRNTNGDVIETADPATINDYRHRAGFAEVKSRSGSKPADDKPAEPKSENK